MKKFDIFLSYSSKDKPFARSLASSLKQEGLAVCWDKEQLHRGKRLPQAVASGLANSDRFVTVLDPALGSTDKTFFEAGMAVGMGKNVIFIVPKAGVRYFPVKRSSGKVVFRKSPSATARDLVKGLKF